MRKFFSIALIALLIFNVLGYYGLFFGLHYQHKQSLINRLDVADYDESKAITLKIPISIPYVADSKEFQRVNGEFEHQGEFYQMVKQRFNQDTLYIVCIKDHTSKRIHQALEDYVKSFTDKPGDAKNSSKTVPTFIKEYMATSYEIKNISSGWSSSVSRYSAPAVFVDSFSASIIHPPERA